MMEVEKLNNSSLLDVYDYVAIALYFIVVLIIGIWSSRQNKSGSTSSYFLASRNMHWIPVGASLFASCIGSGHFVGFAGAGASDGLAVSGFELGAVPIILLLGWIFVPVYMSSDVYTMPEYLKKRFGGNRIQIYLAFLSLILYIFTKISSELYAGALFLQVALNKSSPEWLYISILILLGVAAVFTIVGGLTAVIWTDLVQTILMVIGAFVMMGMSLQKVGGIEGIIEKFPYAIASNFTNHKCGIPKVDFFHTMRSISSEADFPWTGIVFGLTINAIWYWCTDQVIVQRTLASRNMPYAKAGCILCSYIKILPIFILILPGMASRILFPDTVACSDPDECFKICGSRGGCTNIAFPELAFKILPSGMAGLMMAVMMAALMSSLTSIFNSSSTIFTIDVWKKIRKNPSEVELLVVGRCFVAIVVATSVLWIPVIQNSTNSRLFDYIQSVTAFLAPPICAVFLLAVFCKRVNEPGAFWGLMVGLLIGIARFVLEFAFPPPACGSEDPDTRPYFLKAILDNVHYLHFSCILFIICVTVILCVSLMTKPMPPERLHRLTFWTRHSKGIVAYEKKEDGIVVNEKQDVKGKSSALVKMVYLMCCESPTKSKDDEGEEEKETEQQKATRLADFLYESPKEKMIVDMNAILVLCVTIFIWAFFN